ncbi:hypothetical protein [Fructobacillus tropaeoli]|uniref:hypothetical protein n=1 Tax=Fructobacillus tropaeoli TaxID=709323 RepID=UPI00194183AA|nr:hypothetical protein [Fructobacillus tropaeoli]GIC70280.1 hypothetical protein FT12353_09270 [Fructobacillus tropaeoli]
MTKHDTKNEDDAQTADAEDKKCNKIINVIKRNTIRIIGIILLIVDVLVYSCCPHNLQLTLMMYIFGYIFISCILYPIPDAWASDDNKKSRYGLMQILLCIHLLFGFFSVGAIVIFFLSSQFLPHKEAFDFSKWMIGALGLGLNAFNIRLFVDYFRGAKRRAPYSIEQLKQLEILQNMLLENKNNTKERVLTNDEIQEQIDKIKNKPSL